MAESVIVTAFLRGKVGKEEELAGRLQALVRASRLDPGVITYDLHHSLVDPALWFVYERYESQEHLNRHLENTVRAVSLQTQRHLWTGALRFEPSKWFPSSPVGRY